MNISKKDIFNALSNVSDPVSGKDLISQAMMKHLDVDGLKVSLVIEVLPAHSNVNQEDIKQQIIGELQKLSEDLIFDIKFERKKVAPPKPSDPLPDVKNVIAVASGKGGVGKSTVASNLAVALAKKGYSVGLLDADIFGPSVPTMFGVEKERPKIIRHEGKEMIVPLEKYGVKMISIGFLTNPDQAIIWRGAMASKALRQFIGDCDWGELDYLLIDLPPGTSDVHLTLVQALPLTGAVVVTTPQKVALADARRGVGMFRQEQINVPLIGIVENMAYFTPEELPENKYHIFGKDGGKQLAEEINVNLLGQIPIVQSIREHGDEGEPEVLSENKVTFASFSELADNFVEGVNKRNKEQDPSKIVEITRR